MRTFYVCSYGGSGSKMITRYLNNFGFTEHIHSRIPPNELTYVGNSNKFGYGGEWFNSEKIPEYKLNNYSVIFVYRNPINSIYSRYGYKRHLRNVNLDININLGHILHHKKDLYKIEEFFDNYVTDNPNRNYKIYCVKYEDFFENIEQFNDILNLENNKKIYPKKKETNHNYEHWDELYEIYKDLIDRMDNMNFLEIVGKHL